MGKRPMAGIRVNCIFRAAKKVWCRPSPSSLPPPQSSFCHRKSARKLKIYLIFNNIYITLGPGILEPFWPIENFIESQFPKSFQIFKKIILQCSATEDGGLLDAENVWWPGTAVLRIRIQQRPLKDENK